MLKKIIFSLVIVLQTCKQAPPCETRLLSNGELFNRSLLGKFIPKNTPYYTQTGETIPPDSLINFDRNKFALSQYVDCRDSVVKLVVRPITNDDIILRNKIDSLYSNNLDLAIKRIKYIENDSNIQKQMIDILLFNWPSKIYEVNCDSIYYLIDEAFIKDQNNRSEIKLSVDKNNTNLLESIVNNCGFTAIELLGEETVYKSFMIIQHGPPKVREKYIEYFTKASNKGLLNKATLALMIDRTLIDNGKEQIYGTQFKKNSKTGEIEFFPLLEPEKVDLRRREMGLISLDEYKKSIKQ